MKTVHLIRESCIRFRVSANESTDIFYGSVCLDIFPHYLADRMKDIRDRVAQSNPGNIPHLCLGEGEAMRPGGVLIEFLQQVEDSRFAVFPKEVGRSGRIEISADPHADRVSV